MLKILLKSVILFLIVLSVYLIVNPMACSNMLAGRERVSQSDDSTSTAAPNQEKADRIYSAAQGQDELFEADEAWNKEGIFDTNTMKEEQAQPTYSQEDIDRAIATRYVELEREYAREKKVGKDISREISTIVMNDFEMTQAEWEGFLARATASDLFNKVRQDMDKMQESAPTK